ncbi:unnamed protein product [Adineta steineri]|uniref:Uncharacterized protein n=1 Tax=Adineta steineri TaxID=433720 RepID=A0A815JIS6_9BILA|nr:unnamed protein product [Adineta steineri]CAF1607387.1 unnamed protein product [Adineta steineri]
MASLLRNTRSILTRFSCIQRTATTVAATSGTQVKTSGTAAKHSQTSNSSSGTHMAVRDARQRLSPVDAIKPRPAAEPFIPLVGTALNVWGQMALGLIVVTSVYFIYINYITNPEFYKSLKLSREATKRDKDQHSAKHDDKAGHH